MKSKAADVTSDLDSTTWNRLLEIGHPALRDRERVRLRIFLLNVLVDLFCFVGFLLGLVQRG